MSWTSGTITAAHPGPDGVSHRGDAPTILALGDAAAALIAFRHRRSPLRAAAAATVDFADRNRPGACT
jgi:hypothetical protein